MERREKFRELGLTMHPSVNRKEGSDRRRNLTWQSRVKKEKKEVEAYHIGKFDGNHCNVPSIVSKESFKVMSGIPRINKQ